MPEKLTLEVPDELLREFKRLSYYVPGEKDHAQTRRLLLQMATIGIQVMLAQETDHD